MRRISPLGKAALLTGSLGLVMAMAACAPPPSSSSTTKDAMSPSATASMKAGCEAFASYGDLTGKTISVYTSIVEPEAKQQTDSYKPFEDCTGAKIKYEGSREFEAQLPVRLTAGNPPDIAYVPQPGFLKSLVGDFGDKVKAAPQAVIDAANKNFTEGWVNYGTVDGKLYATPLGANVKSFVWYSPKAFKDGGYTIPTTWDELMTLTKKIAADHPDAKPWCAGIESGDATGWPATDFLEDIVLRTAGVDVYDKWVNHEIPFNDPKIVEALGVAGSILKNPAYVNGGIGDVKSIATAAWNTSANGILKNECYLHRAANFYQANWPKGTKVAEDGDVFAFYLPGKTAEDKPLLGGGEFVTAFADRPEVQAFQAYLASPEWANAKAKATGQGWISANKGLDQTLLLSPIDQLSAKLLTDDTYTFRFDGSDQMPGSVGAGSFWKEMTAWVGSNKSDKDVLDAIEKSWPKS